jgi:hypothetical protein
MKKLLILCVAVLAALPASQAFAQSAGLDLTWDDCIVYSTADALPPSNNKDFATTGAKLYNLFGCFKTPVDMAAFYAMDVAVDLQQDVAGPLVPWYSYASCPGGVTFSGNPTAVSSCFGIQSPWGPGGTGIAFGAILGTAENYGQPGRAHIQIAITRRSDDTVPLQALKNYFAWYLQFADNLTQRTNCPGVGTPAVIVWNSATLTGQPLQVVDIHDPSDKQTAICATINGGQLSTCAATPTRNSTWGQLKSIYR